ncbi:MAG: hypothetical protein BA874_07480 [Desulfuromonadales bacterium C00003068]|jgi:hypothetical protein|nr:MAG: hypothetical protein BA874_07480 [Desulfuromonadales bacterium C00003068]
MQWIAYAVWAALALCFLAAGGSYLYYRFSNETSQQNESQMMTEETSTTITLDSQRWRTLLTQCGLSAGLIPSTAEQQLVWANELFGVQKGWLRGEDESMYPLLSFHNDVGASVDFIQKQLQQYPALRLYVVKPEGIEIEESVYEASVVLCFAVPITFQGETTWRFWPINVFWEWGFPPEQVQCCQIIHVALSAGCEVVGAEVDFNDLYDLLEGKKIPQLMINASTDGGFDASWQPQSLAHAGIVVAGQGGTALSAEQLTERIQQAGWGG